MHLAATNPDFPVPMPTSFDDETKELNINGFQKDPHFFSGDCVLAGSAAFMAQMQFVVHSGLA